MVRSRIRIRFDKFAGTKVAKGRSNKESRSECKWTFGKDRSFLLLISDSYGFNTRDFR
jgi:hypothetical protein